MRKLPFGRPETIVGSSPPLNPNSYSSHSTNSPPAKRSCSTMKGLFKTKPRSPPELVRHLRELLNFINRREHKKEKHREEKVEFFYACSIIYEFFSKLDFRHWPKSCGKFSLFFFYWKF